MESDMCYKRATRAKNVAQIVLHLCHTKMPLRSQKSTVGRFSNRVLWDKTPYPALEPKETIYDPIASKSSRGSIDRGGLHPVSARGARADIQTGQSSVV